MENLRLSRTTYQLTERAVKALEQIGRELKRYNDRHEREQEGTEEKDVDTVGRDKS